MKAFGRKLGQTGGDALILSDSRLVTMAVAVANMAYGKNSHRATNDVDYFHSQLQAAISAPRVS